MIADAPLTAGPAVLLTENTGVGFTGSTIANFTDANTFADNGRLHGHHRLGRRLADFRRHWSLGPMAPTPSTVPTPMQGLETYATTVTVKDDGGSAGRDPWIGHGHRPSGGHICPWPWHGRRLHLGRRLSPAAWSCCYVQRPRPELPQSPTSRDAAVTTWGDGTPTSPGSFLTVVQGSSDRPTSIHVRHLRQAHLRRGRDPYHFLVVDHDAWPRNPTLLIRRARRHGHRRHARPAQTGPRSRVRGHLDARLLLPASGTLSAHSRAQTRLRRWPTSPRRSSINWGDGYARRHWTL